MTDQHGRSTGSRRESVAQTFPHRDEHGRVVRLGELLAAALGAAVLGVILVVLVDGVFSLIGIGSFGRASGWLAAILPALLYFDDLRAWRGYGVRFVVGPVALLVALAIGLVAAGVARGLPPLVSGAVGALAAALAYAPVWFVGIRWLTGHLREMGSR